jgi:hypothetical protein
MIPLKYKMLGELLEGDFCYINLNLGSKWENMESPRRFSNTMRSPYLHKIYKASQYS